MAPHTTPLQLNRFAEVGNTLADAAGEVIRKYFRKNFDVIHKHDLSGLLVPSFIFIPFTFQMFFVFFYVNVYVLCFHLMLQVQ